MPAPSRNAAYYGQQSQRALRLTLDAPSPWLGVRWPSLLPFILVHVAALGALFLDVTAADVLLCVALYYVRMFGVTAGYHRYFAHKSYKTGRAFQLFLAVLAQTSAQKGVLWWASHHRHHHKHSDQPEDLHSPIQTGFFFSHLGWILAPRYEETNFKRIPDFARFPELLFLDRHWWIPPVALASSLWALGGNHALMWGFFVSTVLLWHGTFTINSLSHVFGSRRFPTTDTSKNNLALALITMGEGWHNNHHHYCSSANQGFYWWEIDLSYYAIGALQRLGVVWDVRKPPQRVLDQGRGIPPLVVPLPENPGAVQADTAPQPQAV
jgi:stearoyl-CoA desaturase (delta-9 desaturase)